MKRKSLGSYFGDWKFCITDMSILEKKTK